MILINLTYLNHLNYTHCKWGCLDNLLYYFTANKSTALPCNLGRSYWDYAHNYEQYIWVSATPQLGYHE